MCYTILLLLYISRKKMFNTQLHIGLFHENIFSPVNWIYQNIGAALLLAKGNDAALMCKI